MAFKLTSHQLVTKHTKVSEAEKEKLFKKFNIDSKSLPRIKDEDSAISHLKPKIGDVIKIERKSETAGVALYYRVVVES